MTMSITTEGYLPGYTHPPDVMRMSSRENYGVHYPAAERSYYGGYSVSDREYFHNWVFGAASPSEMSSLSPSSYRNTCSSTPSPTGVYHNQYAFTETVPSGVNVWQDCQITTELARSQNIPMSEIGNYETYTNAFGDRCVRRRTSANRKERRRTMTINNAFSNLRCSIPNVPSDTKLSKIKTLRLAINYISYLTEVLAKDDSVLAQSGFKADISKKRERRSLTTIGRVIKKQVYSSDSNHSAESCVSGSPDSEVNMKGYPGWPLEVWASELKSPQTESENRMITTREFSTS